MAVIITSDITSAVRRKAFGPANTGGGNPKLQTATVVRPPKGQPELNIRPQCIPKPYVYPKYLALPIGTNNRGRYNLLRYSCLRTTMRWLKIYEAIKQKPIAHKFPLDLFPSMQTDRNFSPVSGKEIETGKARNVRAAHGGDNL